MIRTRVMLFALASALGYGQYLVFQSDFSAFPRILLHVVFSTLWISAITIFSFSFMRTAKNPDGQLGFNPENPFWRIMSRTGIYGWGNRVSLCKAYKDTFLTFVLFELFVLAVGLFVFSLIMLVIGFIKDPIASLGLLLVGITSLGLFIGYMLFSSRMHDKFSRFKYLENSFFAALIITAIIFLLSAYFVEFRNTSVGAAIIIAAAILAVFAAVVGVAAMIVKWAFRRLPVLRDTWISQVLGTAKDWFCPTLVALPKSSQTAV